jgi:PilZ domain
MSKDRRIALRKVYTIPVQIRVRTEVFAPIPNERVRARDERHAAALPPDPRDGETVNISELGIYFKSKERIAFGEELEMFFRLPSELTGRGPEKVRCSARVVHVDASIDGQGTSGIGVAIGSFARE